jgi:hypothetical protein
MPGELEFVQYATSFAGKPKLQPDMRRRARAAVMNDYLRKTRSLDRKREPLAASSTDLQPITGRFRVNSLPVARSKRRNPTVKKAKKSDAEPAKPSRLLIEPTPTFLRSLDFRHATMEDASPTTRELLDYYLHSYWTNSAAVNPDGDWTVMTLADAAMVHAKLSLVALHRADRSRSTTLPAEHLYHRGKAMTLLRGRFEQSPELLTQTDIGAVALLATVDDHSTWFTETRDTHIHAIAEIVKGQGGIDSSRIGNSLRRVLGWVDLLHATISRQRPLLGMPSMLSELDEDQMVNVLSSMHRADLSSTHSVEPDRFLPEQLRQIVRRLVLLLDLKATLAQANNRPLARRIFSNHLWRLEYEVLQLREGTAKDLWGSEAAIEAFRDASIVCSWTMLREQNSVLLFDLLASRLKDNSSLLLKEVRNAAQSCSGCSITLLWILAMGWKASRYANKSGRWFSVRMLELRIRAGGPRDEGADLVLWPHRFSSLGLEQTERLQLQEEMSAWYQLRY